MIKLQRKNQLKQNKMISKIIKNKFRKKKLKKLKKLKIMKVRNNKMMNRPWKIIKKMRASQFNKTKKNRWNR